MTLGNGIRITLSFGQRRFLLMLADRGRRVRMTFTEKAVGKEALEGVRAMERSALVTIHDLVGSDDKEFVLTDFGSQVVDQMKKRFAQEVYSAREEGSGG